MTELPRIPFCPFVYHDGESIFLEWPGHVLRFEFTEAGLHKALKHLPNVTRQPGYVSGRSNFYKTPAPRVQVARATKAARNTKAVRANVNDNIRNAASELIRKKLSGGGTQ